MKRLRFPAFVRPSDPVNEPIRRSLAASREAASRRILILRTAANGDILMVTPLLRALREAWPDAHLTYMVERRDREAIDANPFVDEILLWDAYFWKRMTRAGLYPLWLVFALKLRRLLLRQQFDVFISFQPEDWPTLARILGGAKRIGVFDTFREYHGQTRTSRRARLFSRAFVYEELPPHRVDQYLLPLTALGLPLPVDKRMVIGFTEADRTQADDFIMRELNGMPFVVIAPMTGWPSRIWPLDRYAAVGDALQEHFGLRVVLVGGKGDKDRAALASVAGMMQTPPVTAAGTFGFRALAAFIARATVVVSGDTGPMHVASAVGTPFVALFGPSPVERFAPLAGKGLPLAHPVPCGPCHQLHCSKTGDEHQLCLRLISTEEVVAAVGSLLNSRSILSERQLAVEVG